MKECHSLPTNPIFPPLIPRLRASKEHPFELLTELAALSDTNSVTNEDKRNYCDPKAQKSHKSPPKYSVYRQMRT
ncbi:hypothetical protein AFLA_004017 [Aspergillus flavus NRRL3357]|nr:hypothetical protein AFLA_004017 [Aspergillus flavus NRRL3357]